MLYKSSKLFVDNEQLKYNIKVRSDGRRISAKLTLVANYLS
jgi:hypothetical protein